MRIAGLSMPEAAIERSWLRENMIIQFEKAASAVLDYTIDWGTDWLVTGDTISTSTWTAQSGVTIDSSSNTSTTATAWISGGSNGRGYTVKNRIVTAGGRTEERSILIVVKDIFVPEVPT